MSQYQIPGDNINLNLLVQENLSDFRELMEHPGVIESSMIYENIYNFTYTSSPLEGLINQPSFVRDNRLYLILEKDNQQVIGIIGLVNIDWIMKRSELILIMDRESRKRHLAYEPVKLLVGKGLREWSISRIFTRQPSEDTITATVLKSFGFEEVGEFEDFIRYKDGNNVSLKFHFLKSEEAHI